jgi:hypothetical protein
LLGTYQSSRNLYILSGGGDINIAGQSSNAGGSERVGLFMVSGVIDSGAGKVRMRGALDSVAGTSWQRAILFGAAGSDLAILSSNSSSDAISIQGDASRSTGGYCAGVLSHDYQNLLIANEGNGGVQIVGDGCASNLTLSGLYTDGIALSDTAVLARSGTISFEGTTRNTLGEANGLFLNRRGGTGADGVFVGSADRTYSLGTGKSVRISTSSSMNSPSERKGFPVVCD